MTTFLIHFCVAFVATSLASILVSPFFGAFFAVGWSTAAWFDALAPSFLGRSK